VIAFLVEVTEAYMKAGKDVDRPEFRDALEKMYRVMNPQNPILN